MIKLKRNTQTIGVDLSTKQIDLNEDQRITLQIWDTGGQERFRSLRTPFYRGADCGILVYSKNDVKVSLACLLSKIECS